MRHPGRTAVTASALMIGVMLVTAVTVVAKGLRRRPRARSSDRISASHVITGPDGWSPIDPEIARTAAGAPGVSAVSALRQDGALVVGGKEIVNGVDPAHDRQVFDFDWKDGSNRVLAALGRDGAIVDDGWATEHHRRSATRSRSPRRRASSSRCTCAGSRSRRCWTRSASARSRSRRRRSTRAFESPARPADVRRRGRRGRAGQGARRPIPTRRSSPRTRSSTTRRRHRRAPGHLLVLLALAVIVSLFGIVNTLVLSTFERTRELGMLRAVGMTRRQVRRMVRHESIITALLGAAMGIAAGLGLAALSPRCSPTRPDVRDPGGPLVASASSRRWPVSSPRSLPARRAARLDVLTALAYE